ncbi:MAG TPA: glycosyltransferase family 1 protein [Burkholderiaceae bacterium]|nr:glycosyltransferase family 1 protein [Burkholderiaceae bacterium]
MHIAYVTETYPPELNGVALTVARLVRGLRARGHAVQLIRPRQSGEAERDSEDEWRAPGIPIPMYTALRIGMPVVGGLAERWSRRRPDLVHVATEGPLGWAAVRAARLAGIPVTSDFRTNFDEYSAHYGFGWMSGAVRAYLRYFHNATDRTLVPTPSVRLALARKGYERLDVIGRGVDCQLFSPAWRSETLRAAWGVADGAPVLLYVGRLASEKNVPLAFRAYEAVRARVPGARMVVVGDGPLRGRLQQQSPDAIFVGQKSGNALAQHYASADIFLFPSSTETFGNVTLEALASALLVVAFRSGAAALHIEDCASGVLVDSGDEQGFIAGACALAQQFRWLGPMRRSARDSALQATWDAVLARFETFLVAAANAVEAPLAGSCPA